jgi:hypothetical protein
MAAILAIITSDAQAAQAEKLAQAAQAEKLAQALRALERIELSTDTREQGAIAMATLALIREGKE